MACEKPTVMQIDASVVMPVYQRADLEERFDKVFDSIISNICLPREIIIVVDGPVTESFDAKICSRQAAHEGIRVVRLSVNSGLTIALNHGVDSARYEFIIRCDGDDINTPTRFEKLWKKHREGYELVGSNILEVDAAGNRISCRNVPERYPQIREFCLRRNPFNHMSVGYSKALWRACGGYPDLYLREDWGLWIRCLKATDRVVNIGEPLVNALVSNGMYRRRVGFRNILGEVALQKTLVRELGKNPIAALVEGVAKCAIMLLPGSAVRHIYLKFLRRG